MNFFTQVRVRYIIDYGHEQDVLVVCHGFLMVSIQRILRQRDYKGERFLKVNNGTLYLFEK